MSLVKIQQGQCVISDHEFKETKMRIQVPLRITKYISAFPGTGKTTAHQQLVAQGLKVSDSDSSQFDKAQFPANYIEHLKGLRGKMDVVFVSSHDVVRAALLDNDFAFTLVYPSPDQKDDYMLRYVERRSPQQFIDLMHKQWDTFIGSCVAQKHCTHIVLQSGQYLGDLFDFME